jgi:chemotaxis signal transduction protein
MAKSKTSSTINALLRLAAIPVKLNPASVEEDRQDHLSFLLFDIGEDCFALGVENIEGVVDCSRITPLPSPPDGIVGVTSARGRMTLVMNLSPGSTPGGGRQRLVLLKGESQLGLLTDRIEDVVTLSAEYLDLLNKRVVEKNSQSRWLGNNIFKNKGRVIPVIDFEKLVEA